MRFGGFTPDGVTQTFARPAKARVMEEIAAYEISAAISCGNLGSGSSRNNDKR